jgi:hypothetical protein
MNEYHYRHDLSRVEYDYIWSQIQVHWGPIYDCWYPLTGEECPVDTIAFKSDEFNQHVVLSDFHRILSIHGISWLWELREDYSGEEIIYEKFLPDYTGNERYWTSSELDWLVYASHENSITIAGVWLINEIKATWIEWEKFLYNHE